MMKITAQMKNITWTKGDYICTRNERAMGEVGYMKGLRGLPEGVGKNVAAHLHTQK
jgi:hypothetical protein